MTLIVWKATAQQHTPLQNRAVPHDGCAGGRSGWMRLLVKFSGLLPLHIRWLQLQLSAVILGFIPRLPLFALEKTTLLHQTGIYNRNMQTNVGTDTRKQEELAMGG